MTGGVEVDHGEEQTLGPSSSRTTLRPREFLRSGLQIVDHHVHRRPDLPEQRSSDQSSSLCHEPADATVGWSPLLHDEHSHLQVDERSLRHMCTSAGIDVRGSAHKRALAHMGYFHGYKGYRFSGSPSRRIPYARFDELAAVVSFDSGLGAVRGHYARALRAVPRAALLWCTGESGGELGAPA